MPGQIESDLISVIVPVYNTADFLDQCIGSVISQTHRNLDIILVNDGSSDSSGEICANYSLIDSRIRVVNQENLGPGAARNVGMMLAKGTLISFVDSDDYIAKIMYEHLLFSMICYDADIVESGITEVYENKQMIIKDSQEFLICSGKEALKRKLTRKKGLSSPRGGVVARLYKRALIEDLKFPEDRVFEDNFFTYRSLLRAKRYCRVNQFMYFRNNTNVESITKRPFSTRNLSIIDTCRERKDYLREQGMIELADYAEMNYFLTMPLMYFKAQKHGMREEANHILSLARTHKRDILHSDMDILKKLRFFVWFFSPKMFLAIAHVYLSLEKLKNKLINRARRMEVQ